MQSAADLYVEVFEVERRVSQLGLTIDVLLDAIRAGFLGRSTCTELDPPTYPGQTMWAHTVRRLRQRTAPIGWKPDNAGNYCVALSADETIAIAVATGDGNTGRPDADPSTNSPKGPRTADAVATNQLLLDLRFPGEDSSNSVTEDAQRETWLLLVHLDRSEVRAELSLPSGLDEQERVTGWSERIILPSIDFDPERVDVPLDNGPDIDIEVRRRA